MNDSQETSQTALEGIDQKASRAFTVKTEVFEGPLDLLLTLIEKRKLFINDISIAKVTDEYIQYINKIGEFSQNNTGTLQGSQNQNRTSEQNALSDRTQFIYIASTLLLIKAKSLLPTLELTEEEQTDIAILEQRLKELAIMRKASLEMQKMFGSRVIFPRGDFKINVGTDPHQGTFGEMAKRIFAPSNDSTLPNITEAMTRVMGSLPKKIEQPKVTVQKTMSLEDMIVRLTDRIKNAVRMSFTEFSGRAGTGGMRKPDLGSTGSSNNSADRGARIEVIVSFLAMLELVKQGVLEANQEGLFDEIHMESQDIGVPRYNG